MSAANAVNTASAVNIDALFRKLGDFHAIYARIIDDEAAAIILTTWLNEQ